MSDTVRSKEEMPPLNWNKSKNYFSPGGESVSVYVDGEWKRFVRHDAVSELFKEIIQKEAIRFAEWIAKCNIEYCREGGVCFGSEYATSIGINKSDEDDIITFTTDQLYLLYIKSKS